MTSPAIAHAPQCAAPSSGLEAFASAMESFGGALIDLSNDANVLALCDAAIADMAPFADKGANRVQDLWRRSRAVRALATLPQVITLLEGYYGRAAVPFQTLNFNFGSQQAAHSDLIHFTPDPIEAMCGVWMALEDVHADAGPLEYYAGSHLWPVLTRADLDVPHGEDIATTYAKRYEPAMAHQIALRSARATPALLRKGQVFVWSANLVHGGMARHSPTRTRRSQVTHFFFDKCGYHTLLTQRGKRRTMRLPQNIATGRFAWPKLAAGDRLTPKTVVAAMRDRFIHSTPAWQA